MFTKKNKRLIFPVLFIVLMAALFLVQPVSADDGTPVDPAAAGTEPVEVVEETAPAAVEAASSPKGQLFFVCGEVARLKIRKN